MVIGPVPWRLVAVAWVVSLSGCPSRTTGSSGPGTPAGPEGETEAAGAVVGEAIGPSATPSGAEVTAVTGPEGPAEGASGAVDDGAAEPPSEVDAPATVAAPADPGYAYPWLEDGERTRTIASAVPPPPGYARVPLEVGSYGDWLRFLPLRPEGSPVRLWDGSPKPGGNVHHAVVDLDVTERNVECADVAMRLRAEYLWGAGRADEIAFAMTDGIVLRWRDWRNGTRYVEREGRFGLHRTGGAGSGRSEFESYLRRVFGYAGTASLARSLARPDRTRPDPGDLLVQGGHPGHGLTVVDAAENDSGDRLILLVQGYMPAQEAHLLRNDAAPSISPWFRAADLDEGLQNPVWYPFTAEDIRSFD